MRITLSEIERAVRDAIVSEARKKRARKPKAPAAPGDRKVPAGYQRAEAHDFSVPPPGGGRYRRQGASGIGPYTSEGALRLFVGRAIREALVKLGR